MDTERYDVMAISLVAIVAIVAVVILVIGLPPSEGSSAVPIPEPVTVATAGAAFDYGETEAPLGRQFDITLLDLNRDGILDFYDVQDMLSGAANCNPTTGFDCDFNDDGYVDGADADLLTGIITRVYDYDLDGVITRDDPHFLLDIMLGNSRCTSDYVCDLDGDGFVSSQDATLYDALIFNNDLG